MNNYFNITEYPDKDIAEYMENYHAGLTNAVSNRRLAEAFDLDERTLRRIILRLINEYGVPIGSSSTRGIFFISCDKECLLTVNEFESRREELNIRKNNVDKNWFNYSNYKKSVEVEQLSLIEVG